jgi:hypothetical protein
LLNALFAIQFPRETAKNALQLRKASFLVLPSCAPRNPCKHLRNICALRRVRVIARRRPRSLTAHFSGPRRRGSRRGFLADAFPETAHAAPPESAVATPADRAAAKTAKHYRVWRRYFS